MTLQKWGAFLESVSRRFNLDGAYGVRPLFSAGFKGHSSFECDLARSPEYSIPASTPRRFAQDTFLRHFSFE